MHLLVDKVLLPKSGLALEIKTEQHLRITDLEGKQVVDMAVFSARNPREKLSTSYSRTRSPRARTEFGSREKYVTKDRLTEGDTLVSTICRPMMFFAKETPEPKGVHKTHNRSCNRFLYESYGGPQDGCLEILSKALAPYGIQAEDIPDTMDLFMNCHHDCIREGWVIDEPVSRPGDYVEFSALMDCIVGLSNCPDDFITPCNGYHCTPVKVEVFEPSRKPEGRTLAFPKVVEIRGGL